MPERSMRPETAELFQAIRAGESAEVQRLLATGAQLDVSDDYGTPLHHAARAGETEIVELLLQAGADVRATNMYGGTPLIPACERAHLDTVRVLIAAGSPLDHVNRLGWTALHEAIVLGDGSNPFVETVRLLAEAGADLTLPDGEGVSPFELARGRGFAEIAGAVQAGLHVEH